MIKIDHHPKIIESCDQSAQGSEFVDEFIIDQEVI
jgi:hypothetical protein